MNKTIDPEIAKAQKKAAKEDAWKWKCPSCNRKTKQAGVCHRCMIGWNKPKDK